MALFVMILSKALAANDINVWFNRLSPKYNPLSFFHPNTLFDCSVKYKNDFYTNTFSEDLEDQTLIDSGIDLQFLDSQDSEHFCRVTLSEARYTFIEKMLKEEFLLEIRVSDLTILTPIGEFNSSEDIASIFTHYELILFFNENQLINVQISATRPVLLYILNKIDFTYSTQWIETSETLETRVALHNIMEKSTRDIYGVSLVCNLTLVFLLTVVAGVGIYWKVQGNQIENRKTGWQSFESYIQKPPEYFLVFSALVACGWHLGLTVFSVVFLNWIFKVYLISGGFAAVCFWTYVLLGTVSGFIYALELYKYKKKMSSLWLMINGTLLNSLFFVVFVVKSISNKHLMNFGSVLRLFFVFSVLYTVLYIFGQFLGKNFAKEYCIRYSAEDLQVERVKNMNRPWVLILFVTSMLFLLIFPVLDSILVARFAFVIYSSYEFLLGCILVYIAAVAISNAIVTFVSLEQENASWCWNSFIIGAGVGLLSFGFVVFECFRRVSVEGAIESLYYFLLVASGCFVIGVSSGAFGYYTSAILITSIYSYKKLE